MINLIVIFILKCLQDVSKRKFLLNSNDPLLSFPQTQQEAKVSIKILICYGIFVLALGQFLSIKNQ